MPENQAPIGVSLADAVAQVRSELERTVKEGQGSTVEFQLGPVGLEFEVGFARTRGVGGGYWLSVLALGTKGERSSTSIHRLKIAFASVNREEEPPSEPQPS